MYSKVLKEKLTNLIEQHKDSLEDLIFQIGIELYGKDDPRVKAGRLMDAMPREQQHLAVALIGVLTKDITPKQIGYSFEKYIAKKLEPNNKIKEWRGDKGDGVIFVESCQNPDFECVDISTGFSFSVECKYRKKWQIDKDGDEYIRWASNEKQIANYNKYAKEEGMPVFIVIGTGGEPDDPEFLFSIPLEFLADTIIVKKKKLLPSSNPHKYARDKGMNLQIFHPYGSNRAFLNSNS